MLAIVVLGIHIKHKGKLSRPIQWRLFSAEVGSNEVGCAEVGSGQDGFAEVSSMRVSVVTVR